MILYAKVQNQPIHFNLLSQNQLQTKIKMCIAVNINNTVTKYQYTMKLLNISPPPPSLEQGLESGPNYNYESMLFLIK